MPRRPDAIDIVCSEARRGRPTSTTSDTEDGAATHAERIEPEQVLRDFVVSERTDDIGTRSDLSVVTDATSLLRRVAARKVGVAVLDDGQFGAADQTFVEMSWAGRCSIV